MLSIIFKQTIQAPPAKVWQVITECDAYPQWNPFITACQSSFIIGQPIAMRVRLLPFFVMPQKETILQNQPEQLLEYGIRLPLGLLQSSRKHLLSPAKANSTIYESVFELNGLLAPLVSLLLKTQLQRGFSEMTQAIKQQAQMPD